MKKYIIAFGVSFFIFSFLIVCGRLLFGLQYVLHTPAFTYFCVFGMALVVSCVCAYAQKRKRFAYDRTSK